MTPKFRILALAAMSLGAAVSARAAPTVGIDFESQALAALTAGAPALITQPIQDIAFTGATVFHVAQTTRSSGYCCAAPTGHDGFVQTRQGITTASLIAQQIAVDLFGPLANGDIESITFDVATGSTDLEFFAVDDQGRKTRFDYNPSNLAWAWVQQTLNLENLGVVKRIEFVNLGAATAVFALDNLSFTLANGGGTVPEPAALGLVALALAAAAAATRQRRA